MKGMHKNGARKGSIKSDGTGGRGGGGSNNGDKKETTLVPKKTALSSMNHHRGDAAAASSLSREVTQRFRNQAPSTLEAVLPPQQPDELFVIAGVAPSTPAALSPTAGMGSTTPSGSSSRSLERGALEYAQDPYYGIRSYQPQQQHGGADGGHDELIEDVLDEIRIMGLADRQHDDAGSLTEEDGDYLTEDDDYGDELDGGGGDDDDNGDRRRRRQQTIAGAEMCAAAPDDSDEATGHHRNGKTGCEVEECKQQMEDSGSQKQRSSNNPLRILRRAGTSGFSRIKARRRASSLFGMEELEQNGENQRGDHLKRLFHKRRIRQRILKALNVTKPFLFRAESLEERAAAAQQIPGSTDVSLISGERLEDSSYYQILQEEVEKEMAEANLSKHILEVGKLWEKYTHLLTLDSIEYPLEVRMQNVAYTVPVDTTAKIMTVYNSSILYPIYKFFQRTWRGESRKPREFHSKRVLDDINLVLKPGKMYLVLGPPGSGKSSLLRAICGRIRPKRDELLEGTISYNGRTLDDSHGFHVENAFGYIDQLDKHAPRFTVQETFEFAYQCKSGGQFIRDKHILLSPQAKDSIRQIDKEKLVPKVVLASLGLTEVKDTFVGDTNVRGVSGGQRRRVTVGEMLTSRSPVLAGDEISTGLDAASTYDMVELILHFGKLRKLTRIFALLQPSPETVSLFDYVIVMAEGKIIYLGPIEDVEDYFAEIGFISPKFTDLADFLQLVATGDGAEFYSPSPELKLVRPNAPTATELADIFRQSDLGLEIQIDLACHPSYVWSQDDSQHGLSKVSNLAISEVVKRKFANRFPRSTYLILRRFLVLWIRDQRVIIAGAAKNILMGLSCGGVFANTDDIVSLQGALFQAGLFIMLGSMQSASGLVADRVIYYKHADANFYSAWPFVFGRTVAGLPQTIMDTFMFGTLMYYIVGFADRDEGANFGTYISVLLVFAVVMNQQMSVFASFADPSSVQVYAACIILLMMLFGGFIVAPDTIPTFFLWAYWWNPFAWAYRALVVNEFRSQRWPDPDQILDATGFVDAHGNPFGQAWIGYSFIYMLGYFLLCCVLTALGLTYIRSSGTTSSSPPCIPLEDEVDRGGASEIPFKRATMSFHDVCYEVTASTSSEKLQLLKGVNGIFRAGRMTALMGSSGAGKTTLLDVIALRKRTGTVTGEVRINGFLQDPISFRRCSGYVEQFDVQTPELTVRETVLFSARLRLEKEMVATDEEVQAFVDLILAQVELSGLKDALVGSDEGHGLSFEQKKRLSIAVELAASPSILFLDEPTSGLDSRSALLVVKTLRKIADTGRSICATIHQPSSAVFGMFDDLLLLKRGGEVVFFGELGETCEQLVSYFESRGAPQINLGENPANWMLRVITSDDLGDLGAMYRSSDEFQRLQCELGQIRDHQDEQTRIVYTSEFAASWNRRQELVNQRLRTIYWRSPTYNLARVMVSICIAIILGSMFLQKYGTDEFTEVEMRARLSVIFLTFIIIGIMAIISVLPVMTQIRDMFYRHRDAAMYNSIPMGIALGVAEKWFIVLSSALFCIVFLSVSDLATNIGGMVSFWGFFTFNFAIYSYFGQFFVCLVKPLPTALILCSVFIGLNNFFSGLIVRPQFMVGTFFALPYIITPGHYVYEGLVTSIYWNDTRPVFPENGSPYNEFLIEEGICSPGQVAPQCVGTVVEYIDYFYGGQFSRDNIVRDTIVLGFILTLTRVLTWLALKYIRF